MKREGQLWLVFFAALLGVPLVVAMCSFLNGRIDEERAEIAGPGSADSGRSGDPER
jgi:hypothetical protein